MNDLRPPILYLRSFMREADVFAELRPKQLRKYSSRRGLGATLEQYLVGELRGRIGPFAALGNPEDYLPPEGAARRYAGDGDWHSQFRQLAQDAACILTEGGQSNQLQFELRALRDLGLHHKLVVLVPPRPLPGWNARLARTFSALLSRMKGIPPRVAWPELARNLVSLGYEVSVEVPVPASVVVFDENGREVRLSAKSGTPTDFVDVIAEHLAGRDQRPS